MQKDKEDPPHDFFMTEESRKPWYSLTEREVKDAKKKCLQCTYASMHSKVRTREDLGRLTCDYILIKNKRRGCRIEDCTHYMDKDVKREAIWNKRGRQKKVAASVTDHTGRQYSSVEHMCKAYEISAYTYKERLRKGYTQEEALIGKKRVMDFKGNLYRTEKEMCQAYGINRNTYRHRIANGMSNEDALTKEVGFKKKGAP